MTTRVLRSILLLGPLLASSFAATGCSNDAAVDRVGVNVVDKGLFTGSWYYSRVVIDVDYAAAGIGTYPGDAANDFSTSALGSMPRIRWVIDEDTLYAYRDYELLEGVNGEDGGTPAGELITHPVAAFGIDSHFDIRRDYNTVTGEEQNVLVENDTDRRWYEREYMRVDWSKNMLPSYYGQIANLYEIIGLYNREPSDLFVQGSSDFPDSWRPQFDFMQCQSLDDESESCSVHERDFAEDYEQGEFYHFSFVTQELLSPGDVPDPFTGRPVNWCVSPYGDAPSCVTTAVYVRNSFMKVSDTRQYEPENWVDSRFDRHGYFRLERNTIDRSTSATDPGFGQTDFINYNANRQNIWRDWTDAEGNAVPYNDRRTRPVVWYTTPELPAHLVQPSFDLVGAWSEVMMTMVRNLRGQPAAEFGRIDCQSADPEGYCFCTANPATGEILNPTCGANWDPFKRPEEQVNVTNPFQCWVEVPAGAQPDMEDPGLNDLDFYGWYGAHWEGPECMVDLRINTCNRASIAENGGTDAGMECQQRGDLRYKYLSYVDQPGTGFLGIATLRGDPVTGEILTGDANIGGPALDGYRTSALQAYDLINGSETNRDFLIGEDVRNYLANVDRINPPLGPREPFLTGNSSVATPSLLREGIHRQMDSFMNRAEQLAGPEGRARTYSQRRQSLAGTDIERRLMTNEDTLAMAGIDVLPPGVTVDDINDNILDVVSPFRVSAIERLQYQNEVERKIGEANVMMPNEFTDSSVLEFVNRHRDWNRAKLEIVLNQLLFYQTELHEMGHCFGLRHDFGASADIGNYDNDYYIINAALPNPVEADFDRDGTNGLSPAEQLAWETEYDRVKDLRELAGVDRWMNSSIMEYTAQWYERTATTRGAGRYDHAAISNAYGSLTELYDNAAGLDLEDINPVNTPRTWVKFYNGGEVCNVSADCAYAADGPRAGELLQGNFDSGLTQECVEHPNGAAYPRICSNFDQDAGELMTSPAPRFVNVKYNFCTDDRVGTRADCHRFDEGDSYREIVANLTEQYDRQYIFTNFRRYRSGFSLGGYLFDRLIGRQYNILQSMFQNLLFRYANDPEYRNTTGNFGFEDHFLATADTLNFYAKVIAQPGIGAYAYDEGWDRYIRRNNDADTPGAQLALPLGMARYANSEYQAGLTGIRRIELIGTFYEKWFTMDVLTARGYTTEYTRDVPFWTNFYDLFPVEMQQIFQGMIANQPEAISPRLECLGGTTGRTCRDARLVYMDFYRGDASSPATTRPDPEVRYADLEVVDSGGNSLLQYLGASFALAEFPVFFDTTFQNQLFLCVQGEGTCTEPSPGSIEFELGDETETDVDFIRYSSENYGKTFVAWRIDPTEDVPNQRSIGFEMLREAKEVAFSLRMVRKLRGFFTPGGVFDPANLTPEERVLLDDIEYDLPLNDADAARENDRLEDRLRDLESFFFQTQQLLREYGIASYIRF